MNMKNFIIEKPKGLKNKGNLQSISGLSAIYNGWANQDININNNFKCTKHIYCGPGWLFYKTACGKLGIFSLKTPSVITFMFYQRFSPYIVKINAQHDTL